MACPELELIEGFFGEEESVRFLRYFLHQHRWPGNQYQHAGRQFVLPRLQTWHADAGIRYSYSNNLLVIWPWTEVLSEIRAKVESRLGRVFNSVLVNCYRNGEDYVGWHADNEVELGEQPVIASVTFGARRAFAYRHKQSKAVGQIFLSNGSLLIMRPDFQKFWLHGVPRDNSEQSARINLTFRRVVEPASV